MKKALLLTSLLFLSACGSPKPQDQGARKPLECEKTKIVMVDKNVDHDGWNQALKCLMEASLENPKASHKELLANCY